jgi:hypothetical protein
VSKPPSAEPQVPETTGRGCPHAPAADPITVLIDEAEERVRLFALS